MIKLDIKEEDLHPYLYEMVNYHWNNGLPFVYTNTKGQVVQQWRNGKIEVLDDILSQDDIIIDFDKRYEEPFEDDGAYAD
jgi:hypothetical protein